MSLKHQILFVLLTSIVYSQQPFTIIIDPAGDAKHTGREIEDTFERGITIQCAQELKQQLAMVMPHVRVVLTRVPGETLLPLQNASFANRLGADFYLTLSFYQETTIPAHVTLFYYVQQPTDIWHTYNPLQFYHASQAYLINLNTTKAIAKNFLGVFQQKAINTAFFIRGIFGVPLQPLLGVKAPALYLEAGLRTKNDWQYLIKPLISCIQTITN